MTHEPTTPLRAVYSTLADDAIASRIEAAYALGPVAECSLARRGFNDVYELRFASGRRAVARCCAFRARGAPNVGYECALLAHLRAAGAAVAAALPTAAGETAIRLAAAEGPRTLVLFEHLVGEPPQEPVDIEATGRGLAQLHRLAEDYRGPAGLYRLDLRHLLRRPLAWLLESPNVDAAMASEFGAIADRVEARIEGLPSLSWVHCHGDCHGGNNFVVTDAQGRRVAWFFDFDDAGPGYLAYDLAVFLWSQHLGKTELDAAAREKWSRYLGAYVRERELPRADLEAIAAFVPVRHLWFLGEYATRRHEWGSQSLPPSWLKKQLELLRGWASLVTPEPAA